MINAIFRHNTPLNKEAKYDEFRCITDNAPNFFVINVWDWHDPPKDRMTEEELLSEKLVIKYDINTKQAFINSDMTSENVIAALTKAVAAERKASPIAVNVGLQHIERKH